MNLRDRIKAIELLQVVEMPWHVKRVLGSISIHGSQVSIGDEYNDYVDVQEFQAVLTWAVDQFGGTCDFTAKELQPTTSKSIAEKQIKKSRKVAKA